MATISIAAERKSLPILRPTLIGGLLVGTLGTIDWAIFFLAAMHFQPEATFQYIASALLGPSAFAGGYTTALVGLLIHFGISFVVAGVFVLAASQLAFVRRTVFVCGLIYGAAVNMFMSTLVLPFTAAPKMQVTTLLIVHGIVADALFVGLTLAIIVWRESRANAARAAA